MAVTEKEFLAALARKLGRPPQDAPPARPGHGRLQPVPSPNMAARQAMCEWFIRELTKLTGTYDQVNSLEEAGAAVAAYVTRTCAAGAEIMLWDDPVVLSAGAPLEAAGFKVTVGPAEKLTYAAAGAGVTSAVYAVAETGSIAVQSAPGAARMASLVPPVHVAILPTSRMMATVGDYFRTIANLKTMPAALNLITGPSRTADIELELSIGVHGPGLLHIVLYHD